MPLFIFIPQLLCVNLGLFGRFIIIGGDSGRVPSGWRKYIKRVDEVGMGEAIKAEFQAYAHVSTVPLSH